MPTFVTREVYENGVLITTEQVEVPEEVVVEQTLTGQAEAAIISLRTVANGTGNLTAAQLTTIVRGMARVLIAILRLQLRRLDSAD